MLFRSPHVRMEPDQVESNGGGELESCNVKLLSEKFILSINPYIFFALLFILKEV